MVYFLFNHCHQRPTNGSSSDGEDGDIDYWKSGRPGGDRDDLRYGLSRQLEGGGRHQHGEDGDGDRLQLCPTCKFKNEKKILDVEWFFLYLLHLLAFSFFSQEYAIRIEFYAHSNIPIRLYMKSVKYIQFMTFLNVIPLKRLYSAKNLSIYDKENYYG